MSTRENYPKGLTLYERHILTVTREHGQAMLCEEILNTIEKIEGELEMASRARTEQHESAEEMELLRERTQWIAILHRKMGKWVWS